MNAGADAIPVVGVVLAAGLSERMGRPKLLLPLGDGTIVGRVASNAAASRLDRVVVVTGAHATEVAAALHNVDVETAHNPAFVSGNMGSLRTGFETAGSGVAVMHLLGDMPGVTSAMIDRMIEVWRTRKTSVTVAEFSDRRSHPLLYAPEVIPTLAALDGAKAVWRYLERCDPATVGVVRFDEPTPIDVDTPEDYERLAAAD